MTTQMKKQKVSKKDKFATITFCLKNRGIRPSSKCNIKMLDFLIEKYGINFEKEFVLMKEERDVLRKKETERRDKAEEVIKLRNEKREIEKKREEDDYKNLPWRIKNICERVYTDAEYTYYMKFIRDEINYQIHLKSRCVTEEEVRNHNTYNKKYPRIPLDEYFPNPLSEYKTTLYKYKNIGELIEELKLDEWYNAKVVIIHRKKKNLY